MKEVERSQGQLPAGGPEDPQFINSYDDDYDAEVHSTFGSLSKDFAKYAEGKYAAYNVPVWIEYDEELAVPAVDIGVLLTRHGLCMIWRSPATPEQFQELQLRMLRVWANRADTGFGRFLVRPARDGSGPERPGLAED